MPLVRDRACRYGLKLEKCWANVFQVLAFFCPKCARTDHELFLSKIELISFLSSLFGSWLEVLFHHFKQKISKPHDTSPLRARWRCFLRVRVQTMIKFKLDTFSLTQNVCWTTQRRKENNYQREGNKRKKMIVCFQIANHFHRGSRYIPKANWFTVSEKQLNNCKQNTGNHLF